MMHDHEHEYDDKHEHQHSHDHEHAHHHNGHGFGHLHVVDAGLKLAFFLNLAIVVVELVGGLMSNSLALLGDAGHNAADAFAIGLAWFAQRQAGKPASAKMSFGYYRSGILVALLNAVSLILIAVVVVWEAYRRILHPESITVGPLFVTAALGLAFNTFAALGLHDHGDMNVRSAFLHLMGDAAASLGVIVGGLVMLFTGWRWVDPVLSVGIAVLIAAGAWDITRRTTRILMEGTPEEVDLSGAVDALLALPGVVSVHDIHVWSLDAQRQALSCHVVVDAGHTMCDLQPVLDRAAHLLEHEFGIAHTTIQMECGQCEHDANACGVPASALRH